MKEQAHRESLRPKYKIWTLTFPKGILNNLEKLQMPEYLYISIQFPKEIALSL